MPTVLSFVQNAEFGARIRTIAVMTTLTGPVGMATTTREPG